MRRFEMVEGSASKFWEVSVDGAELTVRYGRIGTDGQSKSKTFADAAGAAAEQSKLIKEKAGKGYVEVGVQPSTSATQTVAVKPVAKAPPAVKVTATEAPSVEATSIEASSIEAPSSAIAEVSAAVVANPSVIETQSTAAIRVPNEEFVFTAERLAMLPVVRGINAGNYKADLSLIGGWAEMIAKAIQRGTAKAGAQAAVGQWQPPDLVRFTEEFLLRPEPFWTPQQALSEMDRSKLLHADAGHWAEVFTQCFYAGHEGYQNSTLNRCLSVCLALRGAGFTFDVVLRVWPLGFPIREHGDFKSAMADLRHAIALLDDAGHAFALALADAQFGQHPNKDALIAYLMPHIERFANVAALKIERNEAGPLRDTCMDFDHYKAFVKDRKLWLWFYKDNYLTTLLFIVKRFGSARALEILMDYYALGHDANVRKLVVQFAAQLKTPKLIERLVEYASDREVRPVLDKLTAQYPAEAIRAAVERAAQIRSKDLEQWALRFASSQTTEQVAAALAALSPTLRGKFEQQLASLHKQAAPDTDLPSILQSPPWLNKIKLASIPALSLTAVVAAPRYHWQPAPRTGANTQDYALTQFERTWRKQATDASTEAKTRARNAWFLSELKIKNEAHARLLAGGDFQANDLVETGWSWRDISKLLHLPPAVALKLWQQMPSSLWNSYSVSDLHSLLATYGDEALPAALRLVQAKPTELLPALTPIESVLCVPVIAHAAKRLKRVRADAFRWLKRYPSTAAQGLLPLCFDMAAKDKPLRDSAQFATRWLHANGGADALINAANSYGAECAAALQSLLSIDPLHILPSKLPQLPIWFTAGAYARPELKDGRPISVEAATHIGMMAALSTLEEPYGGIEIIKESLDASTLAEFAWSTFVSWIDAGAPSKENFGFLILALFGDDETARRLAPKIREWPGVAAHARAVTGLDYLAAIGSDVALMHLNAIADKAKFKGLQERAKLKISEVAEARGFTRDELSDRLVPDLGLDEAGALKLDFGARHFFVGFDEALKPFVADANGVRLKDLPKPIKSDDADLANAAVERYKAIKKDAKAIASQQIARLEKAMVYGRRWSAADFKLFFLQHPLMQFMSRRLLWGVYQDQKFVQAFRVAEDLSLADSADNLYTLPNDCQVGIAHVLEIPADVSLSFGEIFGDYTILQPFRQLARETYVLTSAEAASSSFTRFANKSVATVSVMGLMSKGWERDGAADGGWVGEFSRAIPDGLIATLRIDPGTIIGDPTYEPYQKLVEVSLRKSGSWLDKDKVLFGQLSPVLASEMIRDLDLLPTASKELP